MVIAVNSNNFEVMGFENVQSYKDWATNASKTGLSVDWYTPIGPLNLSIAQPLSKASTDITETFRFNIGTTF